MSSILHFSQLVVGIKDLSIFVLVLDVVIVVVVIVGCFHFVFGYFVYIFGYKSIINHIRQLVDHYPLFYTKLTSFLPKSLYICNFFIILHYVRGIRSLRLFFNSRFHCFFFLSVSNMLPERIL